MLPEFEEFGHPEWTPEPVNPVHSFLLHLPALTSKTSLFEINNHFTVLPESFVPAISTRTVQIGPYDGLQVLLDVQKISPADEPLEFSITFFNTDNAFTGQYKAFADSTESISSHIFLNTRAPQITKRRSHDLHSEKSAKLNLPTEYFKTSYSEGSQLVQIQLPDELTTPSLRIEQRGNTLPIVNGSSQHPLVYLPERRNIVTDQFDAVFLFDRNTSSEDPSPVISERSAFQNLSPQGVEVALRRNKKYESNPIYERATPLPIGERFVEYRVSRNQTKNFDLPFYDRLVEPEVNAVFNLASLTATVNVDPDHYATLTLDGAIPALEASWKGRTAFRTSGNFALNPTNYTGLPATIEFSHHVPTVPNGPNSDLQNLDFIELSWVGSPRIESNNRLLLTLEQQDEELANQSRLVTVGGFDSETPLEHIYVLEVTDETNPVLLKELSFFIDETNTLAVEFEALPSEYRFSIQLFDSTIAPLLTTPSAELPSVTEIELLKGIYVCPKELQEELQPLLDLRGEGYVVLDPEAAYNTYSGGQESPEAIREAIRYLITQAPSAVDFPAVTLVGFATFDPRNYLGFIDFPHVPTFVDESVEGGFTIENCVDFPYGLLFGDDDFIDANVARLPAKTKDELTLMVNRIIAQDSISAELTELNRAGIFIYDDDDNENNLTQFLESRETFENLWNSTQNPYQDLLVVSNDGFTEQPALKELMETQPRSAAMVFYMGHGNNDRWSSKLMNSIEAVKINTQGGYPFIATFTCLNAYYAFPGGLSNRSLSEAWLLSPIGTGGVASFSPSGADTPTDIFDMVVITMNIMAEDLRPRTIGELVTRVRIQYTANHPNQSRTNRVFLLFGDPLSPTTIEPDFLRSMWMLN
ncbi:MAG: C25 family cysteine peptidase [Sumerlaeia bacterium]